MKIQDILLDKFEIHYDGSHNYIVVENMNKVNKKGKPIYKTLAYCSSMKIALNRLIKFHVENTEAIMTLKQYVFAIEQSERRITSLYK